MEVGAVCVFLLLVLRSEAEHCEQGWTAVSQSTKPLAKRQHKISSLSCKVRFRTSFAPNAPAHSERRRAGSRSSRQVPHRHARASTTSKTSRIRDRGTQRWRGEALLLESVRASSSSYRNPLTRAHSSVKQCADRLPENKARYCMGVGSFFISHSPLRALLILFCRIQRRCTSRRPALKSRSPFDRRSPRLRSVRRRHGRLRLPHPHSRTSSRSCLLPSLTRPSDSASL